MKPTLTFLALAVTSTAMGQGLPRAKPADVGLSPDSLEWIAPALRSQVESGKVPGLIAVVARHGKLAYVNSIGTTAMPGPQPTAVFRIFSMTKPIRSEERRVGDGR